MILPDLLEAAEKFIANPLQYETVWRQDMQAIGPAFKTQGFDPVVELLRGKLLLESAQTSLPESFH
jgi:hypothetical protein